MAVRAKFDSDKKPTKLIIEIDLEEPKASATGKTLGIASTHGNQDAGLQFHGKPVKLGLNAYISAK